jgi:hypothetical protein
LGECRFFMGQSPAIVVCQETNAKGSLTRVRFSVVGLWDCGIVGLFAFCECLKL